MAIPLLAISTAISTIAAIREGQQMGTTEKYNARVAEAQAEGYRNSAAFQSKTLQAQSEFEQAQIARAKKKTQGTQRALYAKSGVQIDEGSPLEVQADTAAQYELDIAANRYNTQVGLEQIRYESELGVARSLSEAEYRRRLGKSYQTASYLKAGSTLLTGLATMRKQ